MALEDCREPPRRWNSQGPNEAIRESARWRLNPRQRVAGLLDRGARRGYEGPTTLDVTRCPLRSVQTSLVRTHLERRGGETTLDRPFRDGDEARSPAMRVLSTVGDSNRPSIRVANIAEQAKRPSISHRAGANSSIDPRFSIFSRARCPNDPRLASLQGFGTSIERRSAFGELLRR